MKIIEVTTIEDVKVSLDIYKTYNPSEEEFVEAEKALEGDFIEIETNRKFFIAYEQNEAVGSVQLLLKNADNDPELADGKTTAHVHNLRVRRTYQRQGLGSTIMQYLEDYVRDSGFKKLTLGVDNWNENAVRFYNSLGYIKLKEVDGRTDDEKVFYMYKVL